MHLHFPQILQKVFLFGWDCTVPHCKLLSRTVTDIFLHSALLKLQELEMLNLNGMGINFHKLQVYSNTLEDVIQESPTFSYILRCIKVQGSLTIVTFMVWTGLWVFWNVGFILLASLVQFSGLIWGVFFFLLLCTWNYPYHEAFVLYCNLDLPSQAASLQ